VHVAARALEKRSAALAKRANTGKVALKDYLESYIDASYSGPITVGTPAQAFTILLDSGSGDIWLPEVGSGTKHATYDASKSSTSTTSETSWGITYESGDSLTGTLVQDSMTFGGLTVAEQIFAQANVTQSLWEELPSSGDFGFAFSRISRTGAPTFFENLISEGDVANPYIGVYLKRASDSSSKSDGWLAGGSMCVGCIDSSYYTGAITYAPVTYQGWWEVAMDGVAVNNVVIKNTAVTAAIDTGTSLVYLPKTEATAFYKGVGATLVDGSYTIPCDTTKTVGLSFAGVVYNIPLSDLSLGYVSDDHTNDCVLGIQALNVYDAQGKSAALVGDLFLKAVYTVFSYSTNGAPAVGFAESVTSDVTDVASGSSSAAVSAAVTGSVNGTAAATAVKTSTVATKAVTTSKYVAKAAPTVKSIAVESIAVYTPKSVAAAKSSAAASGKSNASTTRATKVQGFSISVFNGVSSYSAKAAASSSAASAASAAASADAANSAILAASASAQAQASAASASASASASSIANANVATSTAFTTTDASQATVAASSNSASTPVSTSAAASRAVGLGAVLAFAVAAFAVAL